MIRGENSSSLPDEKSREYVARMMCLYTSGAQGAMLAALLKVSYLSVPAVEFADRVLSRNLRSIPSELLYIFDLPQTISAARNFTPEMRGQFRVKLHSQYREKVVGSVSHLIDELSAFGRVKLEQVKSQLSSDALSGMYGEPAIYAEDALVRASLVNDITILRYSSWQNTLDRVRANDIELVDYSTIPKSLSGCRGLLDEITKGQIKPSETYWAFSSSALNCLGEIGLPDQIDGVINNLVVRDVDLQSS